MSNIGTFIKAKREAAGISQKTLGSRVNVSDSEIHKIETGQRQSPNWQTLCDIGKVLEISPLEMLEIAEMLNEEDILPEIRIKGLSKLTDEQLEQVQDYVNFLLFKETNK